MTSSDDRFVLLELPNDLDAPSIARRFVAEHAKSLPISMIQDAELLVSEIVTNAVRHGRPAVTLRLRLDPPGLGVFVHDFGDAAAIAPDGELPTPDALAPGGRGLLIVKAIAHEWGVEPSDPPPGKTVWFQLRP